MSDPSAYIFDTAAVLHNRARAETYGNDHTFLKQEISDRLHDRLHDITRPFQSVLDIGGDFARFSGMPATTLSISDTPLPTSDNQFDLVISNLVMHWVNDLPGLLIQLNRALKPDGLMMAAMFGGETLKELRHSLLAAESELTGGAHGRVIPFADVKTLGSLLQRAGFALPVTDMDTLTVTYEHPLKLLADLRGMGEANALLDRPKNFMRRDVLSRALEIYSRDYAQSDGRVPATFQIIYLTGWHPHESQQKPAKRGSGQVSLAAALKAGAPPQK
ncbi:methyltransferase domain-containing protein [Kordiimonas pumila]|uniref:Methyltransferase domain-containing protein n=1 Tax=Kordiimonas pumila TaxID=2161677 RepID=A0ABV7D0S6_9PROT|nr:methyltransferase domain-containing protein [Kordiimonas pumila]